MVDGSVQKELLSTTTGRFGFSPPLWWKARPDSPVGSGESRGPCVCIHARAVGDFDLICTSGTVI
jgi:hypothetical protein